MVISFVLKLVIHTKHTYVKIMNLSVGEISVLDDDFSKNLVENKTHLLNNNIKYILEHNFQCQTTINISKDILIKFYMITI